MSQTQKLPPFGDIKPFTRVYDLKYVLTKLHSLVDAEEENMKGKGYTGAQSRRLELGQKALDLLWLMYGWEK